MQAFLDQTAARAMGSRNQGEVKYGDRAEHCWNGDPNLPNALSRLHYKHNVTCPRSWTAIRKTPHPMADMSWNTKLPDFFTPRKRATTFLLGKGGSAAISGRLVAGSP